MEGQKAPRAASPHSERLRSLTRSAYSATSGHLDLDGEVGAPPAGGRAWAAEGSGRRSRGRPRRWAIRSRAALVTGAVVLLLAAMLGLRALVLSPAEPVPLPAAGGAAHDGSAHGESAPGGGGDRAPGSGSPDGQGGDASGPADGHDAAAREGGAGSDGGPGADGAGGSAPPGVAGPAGTGGLESGGGSSGGGGVGEGPGGGAVVVHVAGSVTRPGVVHLAAGARVADALDSAGGALPTAELAAINLARVVVDGEQVYVPAVGEAAPGSAAGPTGASPGGAPGDPGPGGTSGAATVGLVDLNTASLAELETLPGIGPAIGQRILDWRDANGPFLEVDELLEVSGIGPATLERLRDRVRA